MWNIVEGDCRERLTGLETGSVDCVITDPPYPGALRSYGVMAEGEWLDMMDGVVDECKRVVKPGGSAMFVVQPNGEHVGQMRLWLYEFVLRAGRRWNLVQDVLWFNTTPPPNKWCNSDIGSRIWPTCSPLGCTTNMADPPGLTTRLHSSTTPSIMSSHSPSAITP
jgi:DNA modification methylase